MVDLWRRRQDRSAQSAAAGAYAGARRWRGPAREHGDPRPPRRARRPRAGAGRRATARAPPRRSGSARWRRVSPTKRSGLFYELVFHPQPSQTWVDRCRAQIADVVAVLERERGRGPRSYWFGDAIGHADIAVACALRFAGEAHPDLVDLGPYPALAGHAADARRCRCSRRSASASSHPRAESPLQGSRQPSRR